MFVVCCLLLVFAVMGCRHVGCSVCVDCCVVLFVDCWWLVVGCCMSFLVRRVLCVVCCLLSVVCCVCCVLPIRYSLCVVC